MSPDELYIVRNGPLLEVKTADQLREIVRKSNHRVQAFQVLKWRKVEAVPSVHVTIAAAQPDTEAIRREAELRN